MGTNKRYAAQIDRRMDQKVLEQLALKYPMQSLTERELAFDQQPLTNDPQPLTVEAWVRFGPIATKVTGKAVSWTPRAVCVAFTLEEKETRVWVWASAVDRTGC